MCQFTPSLQRESSPRMGPAQLQLRCTARLGRFRVAIPIIREWKLRTEPVPVDQEHSFLLGSFPHAFGEAGPAEENIAFDPGILMPINPLGFLYEIFIHILP